MDHVNQPFAYAIKNDQGVVLDWGITFCDQTVGKLRTCSEILAEAYFNDNSSVNYTGVLSIEFRDRGSEAGDLVFSLKSSTRIVFSAKEVSTVNHEA